MSENSWQCRAEWYEKECQKRTKALLKIDEMLSKELIHPLEVAVVLNKIKKMIKEMNLESGWVEGS
jgi:hypothetical protein